MACYLGYQNNKIVAVADSEEALKNIPFVTFDMIIKSEKSYFMADGYSFSTDNTAYNVRTIANRIAEYPSIEEQLDMMYWDSINGTKVWQNTITRIKKRYPKR